MSLRILETSLLVMVVGFAVVKVYGENAVTAGGFVIFAGFCGAVVSALALIWI